MLKRRLGRLGFDSSVVMFGGAALSSVTQDQADAAIDHALRHGINHFDTAASYGVSEDLLRPWMPNIRKDIFLATKTGERKREQAKRQIERSLERMGVTSVDLLQLHSVGTMEELDQVTAKDGALEAALEAQRQGLVGAIGITGHGHTAPSVHLEALRRFPFAAVLTPYNFVLYANAQYRADFDRLAAATQAQDVALRVIKAVARGRWPEGARHRYATWYEPFDEAAQIDRCVHFALSHPATCAIAGPGDIGLLPLVISAAERYIPMDDTQAGALMATAGDYASPFGALPA